jgi:cytochrome b561
MPNTVEKLPNFKIHMILGFVILLLTIIRYFVNKNQKLVPLVMSSFRQKMMNLNHTLIYLVLILVVISGVALSMGSGFGEIVFFGSEGELYKSFEEFPMGVAHSILTKVLMFLIAMHIVGVFSYILKTKENILKRMWFK